MMDHPNMEKWETRTERKEEQKGGLGEVVSLQSKAMGWEEEEGVGGGCATRGQIQDAEGGLFWMSAALGSLNDPCKMWAVTASPC